MNKDTPKALDAVSEREAFEAWIRTRPGHPFAGQFANLMWAAWQARAALSTSTQQAAKSAAASDLVERLKMEAQIHAGEARAANVTIAEIYRIVTGGTGEPGNWHGAEPVRKCIEELRAQVAAKSAAPAAVGLEELHDLLYTAQRTTGDAQEKAIGAARLVLHKLREGVPAECPYCHACWPECLHCNGSGVDAPMPATQAPAAVDCGEYGHKEGACGNASCLAAKASAYQPLPAPVAHRYWSEGHRPRWQLAGKAVPPDAEPLFSAAQMLTALSSPMPAGAAVGDDRKVQP